MDIVIRGRGETNALTWDDIDIGDLIGTGSTASIFRVRVKSSVIPVESAHDGNKKETWKQCLENDRSDDHEMLCHRRNVYCSEGTDSARSCHSESVILAGPRRYALKRLSVATLSNVDETIAASTGMRFEANLLMNLLPPHPNIIRLFGISDDLFTSPDRGFIVVECLVETLQDRIERWKIKRLVRTSWGSCPDRFNPKRSQSEQRYRIQQAGLGIAQALKYLHKNQVLYRDLKPANVGFDDLGQVRLFDFGHSRMYCQDDADRNLTMRVGSLRYMSPECANGCRYDFSSDVHSFAILLWEVCTLERPFSRVPDALRLTKLVFKGERRPPLRSIALPDIKHLLRTCWDPDPNLRLTFTSVVGFLQACVGDRKIEQHG